MKTYETLKWGNGYYVMTRVNGHAEDRKYCKTKTARDAEVKALKKQGYVTA